MASNELSFREHIYKLVIRIPVGMVTTYGDMAALAGQPLAARVVGGIAHYGDVSLPWHRIVNRFGGLASGFPGGREVQEKLLEQEGIYCRDGIVVDFARRRWRPEL